jgi:hypothetical protein
MPQIYISAMARVSLATPRKDELVNNDSFTLAIESELRNSVSVSIISTRGNALVFGENYTFYTMVETCSSEYLTGKTSRM